MRHFIHLKYKGTNFSGWQSQPNAISVQEEIERSFSTVLNRPIKVMGCGRTDTGVHATDFYAHFDFDGTFPDGFIRRMNKFISNDILILNIIEVKDSDHARFDAVSRSYVYKIAQNPDPFTQDTVWVLPHFHKLDVDKLNQFAVLIKEYKVFFPFCKTNSDSKTMNVEILDAKWEINEKNGNLLFYIKANRFLRGMVRLLVGAGYNIALGKLTLAEVKYALDKQIRLPLSYSVPAHGLFLTKVEYPNGYFDNKIN